MGKRSRKQRQEARGSQSNCSVSASSLLDRLSDTSVLKSANKKQRSQQAVNTPLRHKDILSQFEFVPRSMSVADKMDSGGGTVDCSTDLHELSPLTLRPPMPHSNRYAKSKGVTNEDLMLKLCANNAEISKLAQTKSYMLPSLHCRWTMIN